MKRKFNEGKGAQNPEQKRPRSQSGYIGDPRLVPRVRQVSILGSDLYSQNRSLYYH